MDELETAMAKSTLPEQARGKAALNDLLVRIRLKSAETESVGRRADME